MTAAIDALKIAIHQPVYFPYPGFFHKVNLADALVVMDDVRRDKRYSNRNVILTSRGPTWLTVPLKQHQGSVPSRYVKIDTSQNWGAKQWKAMYLSYARAKFFGSYKEYFQGLFGRTWEMLYDLDLETMKKVFGWLGMNVRLIPESELNVKGTGTERLVNVCKAAGADTYLSGAGGRQYVVEQLFERSGIKLEYDDYKLVPYPQRFSTSFIPNLSILDALFNVGGDCLTSVTGKDVPDQAERVPSAKAHISVFLE
jgi:hypothetical protein